MSHLGKLGHAFAAMGAGVLGAALFLPWTRDLQGLIWCGVFTWLLFLAFLASVPDPERGTRRVWFCLGTVSIALLAYGLMGALVDTSPDPRGWVQAILLGASLGPVYCHRLTHHLARLNRR